jgi:plastocyanin
MQFTPARVDAKKGATVTWTQSEPMPHKVTANNGGFGSDTLTEGEIYARTLDEAGTFGYYCGLHPSMRGQVVVVD